MWTEKRLSLPTHSLAHSSQQVNSNYQRMELNFVKTVVATEPSSYIWSNRFGRTWNYSSSCKHATKAVDRTVGEKDRKQRGWRSIHAERAEPSVGCMLGLEVHQNLSETKHRGWQERIQILDLPMMGASREMSERRLFTGSYGESSKKSLPVRKIIRGQSSETPPLVCLSSSRLTLVCMRHGLFGSVNILAGMQPHAWLGRLVSYVAQWEVYLLTKGWLEIRTKSYPPAPPPLLWPTL